jgi:DNA-directed RNA polymerase subunit RPC12/RpoP
MNFMPPRYGELVPLVCLKCHKHFVGPNPTGESIFEDLFKKRKKAKCPECGSYKVIRDPFIRY